MSRTIPIFHCFDHNYVLPAAVAFRSMLDHAKSPDTTYALYVVGRDLTDEDRAQLQSVVAPFPQATLTFLSPPPSAPFVVEAMKSAAWNPILTADLFYKLEVPDLLPEHDLVIVADVDVVYADDVARVYDAVAGDRDFYVAGGRDLAYAGWRGEGLYPHKRRKISRYFELYTEEERNRQILGAGLMVFNNALLRRDGIVPKWRDWAVANAQRLILPEQDIINQVCSPRLRALPWNHMVIAPAYAEYVKKGKWAKRRNPTWDAMFTQPVQIHYATSRKPWKDSSVPMADRWFAVVRELGLLVGKRTIIGKPRLQKTENGAVRLVACITSPEGERQDLWFEVDSQFADGLVAERCDAFLVGLIPYIALQGGQVLCEAPVSAHLLHNLRHLLSPVLPLFQKGLSGRRVVSSLTIAAEPDDSCLMEKSKGHVGTGVSCGIDSMATICTYTTGRVPSDMRVDTLCYFDLGSHGEGTSVSAEQLKHRQDLARERGRNVEAFASEIGLPVLRLKSNVHAFGCGLGHRNVHTFRNAAAVLSLQHYFGTYHYASAYRVSEFGFTFDACAHADEFLLRCFSTETTTFYSSLSSLTRQERTAVVASYPPACKYLNVCLNEARNCGFCSKCARTEFQLELCGTLEKFKSVFPVNAYRASRGRILKLLAKDIPYHAEFLESAAHSQRSPFGPIQMRWRFFTREIVAALIAFRKRHFGKRKHA